MSNFPVSIKFIVVGHCAMILCCIFYLAWWNIAFRPVAADGVSSGKAGLLLVLTILCGAVGVIGNIYGIQAITTAGNISPKIIGGFGVVSYVILLIITKWLFSRPVTSELLLIVAWTTLEVAVILSIYNLNFPLLPIVIIGVATILAMIAYLLYYSVDEWTAFYLGMIPLVIYIISMVFLMHIIIDNFITN